MRESKIETRLVKRVREVGGWAIKFSSGVEAGLPDRICVFPAGILIWVEVKAPGEGPRKLQWVQIKKLKALGQYVAVVDSMNKIEGLIRWYHDKRYLEE